MSSIVMFSRLRMLIAFVFVALPSVPLSGQDSCLRRVLPLIVQDGQGVPVAGISAADLSGEFRGKPVQILSVTVDERPRQIVILLEAGEGMVHLDNGKWALTLRVVADLLSSLPQKDAVSLTAFWGKEGEEAIDPVQGREAILKRLRELAPGTTTFPKRSRSTIWDAILASTSSPQPLHSGDVIYLVGDGEDNTSSQKYSQMKRKLLERGIRVFALLLPLGHYYGEEERNDIMGLVTGTGGVSLVFSPKQFTLTGPSYKLGKEELLGLERALATHLSFVSRPYHVEISLPVPVDKFRSWKLSPSRSAVDWRKDVRLTYPSELVPCQPASSPN